MLISKLSISIIAVATSIICIVIVLTNTHKPILEKKVEKEKIIVFSLKKIDKDTAIIISGIPVEIKIPKIRKRDLLILPGWNFRKNLWCDSTKLCGKALEQGYTLVMPEMGKSIYASKYFPESRKDWIKYPTLTWVTDTMIPYLQKEFGIFCTKNNFIIGNSTGGRGAVLVAIKSDSLFIAGAALSGDYNQTKMIYDNLMKGVYGDYKKFNVRWESIDNPTEQISRLNTSFYFAHGTKDKVVPYSQTKTFYNSLIKIKPNLKFVLSSPPMGHNFKFWNSQLDSVFYFFESFKK